MFPHVLTSELHFKIPSNSDITKPKGSDTLLSLLCTLTPVFDTLMEDSTTPSTGIIVSKFIGLEPRILMNMWYLHLPNMKINLIIINRQCGIGTWEKTGLGSRKETKHKTNLILHMEESKIIR